MISLLDGQMNVLDRVMYATDSAQHLGWPARQSRVAICYRGAVGDPEANNYGQSWDCAGALILGSDTHFGNPGVLTPGQ